MSIITITEVGTIRADLRFEAPGIDGAGIFGPRGASLVGQHFTAVFTGSDCNCTGGVSGDYIGATVYGTGISPVQDATLTINDITYHFGPGYYGDMFFMGTTLFQVNTSAGYLNIGSATGEGSFKIVPPLTPSTTGYFIGESISNSFYVPGPIAGTDLPGLLLAALIIFGGFYWKRRYAGTSRHDTLPMP